MDEFGEVNDSCFMSELDFVVGRPNQSLELTAMEHRGSVRKGNEEFALSGLSKRLLAAVQVRR